MLHINTLDPTLTVTAPSGATQHIHWIQPWRWQLPVAQHYTYNGSNPDGDSSLWWDATQTLDPTLMVTAPCGGTLHIHWIQSWRWQLPVARHYTYTGSNPDGDSSLWRDIAHTLDPTPTVTAPCGATLHIHWIQPWWWQLPVAQHYTYIGSNTDGDSSLWSDTTHTLDPTLTVIAPYGAKPHITWFRPTLTVTASCGATPDIPWIQPRRWQLPVLRCYTYLRSNPDGVSSQWRDATHTLDPTLMVTAPCGVMPQIGTLDPIRTVTNPWRCTTVDLPWIQPWMWRCPLAWRCEDNGNWKEHWIQSWGVTAPCGAKLHTLDPTLTVTVPPGLKVWMVGGRSMSSLWLTRSTSSLAFTEQKYTVINHWATQMICCSQI